MNKIVICQQNLSNDSYMTECNIESMSSDLQKKYPEAKIIFLTERTLINNNVAYFFFNISDKKQIRMY
jgi:hypothetical protein